MERSRKVPTALAGFLGLWLMLSGWTPLKAQDFFTASWQGRKDILERSLEENPDLINALSEWDYSALMTAVLWGGGGQREIVDFLLEKGADINLQNSMGKTILHLAAQHTNERMVEFLLKRGANRNIKDKQGRPPYFYAVTAGNIASVDLLYDSGMTINITREDAPVLLHAAVRIGYSAIAGKLTGKSSDLQSIREDGGTMLHSAVEGNMVDLIATALHAGIDTDRRNIYRYTPLHLAAMEGKTDAARILLDAGAESDLKDNLGRTAFHMAEAYGHDVLADLLCGYGAKQTPYRRLISGPYLGQDPPGLTPEIFAPGIVSTAKGFEFAGVFTPDGKEFFFTQRGLGFGQRIRYMKLEGKVWSEPDFAPFTYDAFEFEPNLSPDGNILFYGSRRPLPGQDEENRSTDIWLVRREVDGWSDPEHVGTGMMYVTVNGEGTIYTTGRMGDGSDQGIVMHTFKDGVLGEAVGLGERVNYMQGTAHPYIAPDESYLIFDAQPNGIEAGPDLFISFKQEDGSWGRAVAFGDEVNKGSEMCATVSPDGRYMFFARDGDIFWVDAGIIDLMRVKVR